MPLKGQKFLGLCCVVASRWQLGLEPAEEGPKRRGWQWLQAQDPITGLFPYLAT